MFLHFSFGFNHRDCTKIKKPAVATDLAKASSVKESYGGREVQQKIKMIADI
jgi:hypothetical protein